jgi:hypothetical protein
VCSCGLKIHPDPWFDHGTIERDWRERRGGGEYTHREGRGLEVTKDKDKREVLSSREKAKSTEGKHASMEISDF